MGDGPGDDLKTKVEKNPFDEGFNDVEKTGIAKTEGDKTTGGTVNPLLEGTYGPPEALKRDLGITGDAKVQVAETPKVVTDKPVVIKDDSMPDGTDLQTYKQEVVGPGGELTIYNIRANQVFIDNGAKHPAVGRVETHADRMIDQGVAVRPGDGPVYVSVGGQGAPYFRNTGPRGIPRHVGYPQVGYPSMDYGYGYGNDGIVIDAPNGNFPVVRDTTMGGPTTIFRDRRIGSVMDNPMIIQEQPRSIGFNEIVQLAQLGLIGYDISQNGGRGSRGYGPQIGYGHRQQAGWWQSGGFRGDSGLPPVTVMSDSGYIPPISQRDWRGPSTVFQDTQIGTTGNTGFDQFLQVAQLGLIGLDIHESGKANRRSDRDFRMAMNNQQRFQGGRIGYNNLAAQARMSPQNFQARLAQQRAHVGFRVT